MKYYRRPYQSNYNNWPQYDSNYSQYYSNLPQYTPNQYFRPYDNSDLSFPNIYAFNESINERAFYLISQFLEKYNGYAFSDVVSLGNVEAFRNAILNTEIVVDPTLKSLGKYDPKTKKIYVPVNPFDVNVGNSSGDALAETLWHETAHRIEDLHGDPSWIWTSEDYKERNVEYMASVIRDALSRLVVLEKHKDDYSADQLSERWNDFVRAWTDVNSNRVYPPDAKTLKDWFGFDVNMDKIKNEYAQGIPNEKFKEIMQKTSKQFGTETLTVPNTEAKKVSTSFATKKGATYIIEASGVVSDWSDKSDGVDAVWCYAEWRCGKTGEPWQQLRIDDKGMMEITGGNIPYNPGHTYRIEIPGTGAPFVFHMIDAQNSAGDNSGAIQVTVKEK